MLEEGAEQRSFDLIEMMRSFEVTHLEISFHQVINPCARWTFVTVIHRVAFNWTRAPQYSSTEEHFIITIESSAFCNIHVHERWLEYELNDVHFLMKEPQQEECQRNIADQCFEINMNSRLQLRGCEDRYLWLSQPAGLIPGSANKSLEGVLITFGRPVLNFLRYFHLFPF